MAGFLAEDSSVCQQERTSRPLGSMESVAASSGQESRIWDTYFQVLFKLTSLTHGPSPRTPPRHKALGGRPHPFWAH